MKDCRKDDSSDGSSNDSSEDDSDEDDIYNKRMPPKSQARMKVNS